MRPPGLLFPALPRSRVQGEQKQGLFRVSLERYATGMHIRARRTPALVDLDLPAILSCRSRDSGVTTVRHL